MLSRVTKAVNSKNLLINASRSFSVWENVKAAPADPILGLNEAFLKDTAPNKILLGMGVYRDNENKPYVLPSVRKAEEIILSKNMNHEYAPISGIANYV